VSVLPTLLTSACLLYEARVHVENVCAASITV